MLKQIKRVLKIEIVVSIFKALLKFSLDDKFDYACESFLKIVYVLLN